MGVDKKGEFDFSCFFSEKSPFQFQKNLKLALQNLRV